MLDSPVQYRRSVRLLMVSGLRPKDVCMCVRTRREDVSVSHCVGFGEVLTFGLFLFLRYCLFSILGLFMPPARNPSRLCVHRRSCSSHRADQRGWASLLGGEESEHKTVVSKCNNDDEAAVAGSEIFNQLTWPEGLCVSHSNEAGVVNFSLWEETKTQMRN